MPSVRSDSTCTRTLPGRLCCSAGNSFLMASTVAITLAPGWRCTFRMMAGVSAAVSGVSAPWRPSDVREPLSFLMAVQAPRRLFSEPSVTRATSFSRTGAPPT